MIGGPRQGEAPGPEPVPVRRWEGHGSTRESSSSSRSSSPSRSWSLTDACSTYRFAISQYSRWISIGEVSLQPGLFLLPLLTLAFVRSQDGASLLGILIAALAVALQPDRAMAGALVAGMAALGELTPISFVVIVLLVVACGLVVVGMVKGLVRLLVGLAALVASMIQW